MGGPLRAAPLRPGNDALRGGLHGGKAVYYASRL